MVAIPFLFLHIIAIIHALSVSALTYCILLSINYFNLLNKKRPKHFDLFKFNVNLWPSKSF